MTESNVKPEYFLHPADYQNYMKHWKRWDKDKKAKEREKQAWRHLIIEEQK